MVDFHKQLINALSTVLPTHYELALKSQKTPCISYMELNNYQEETGDTIGYSRLTYQVKVWGTNISDLQRYALMIDKALRPLGFKRIASGELFDNNSAMIQKIMTYEALALEKFNSEV